MRHQRLEEKKKTKERKTQQGELVNLLGGEGSSETRGITPMFRKRKPYPSRRRERFAKGGGSLPLRKGKKDHAVQDGHARKNFVSQEEKELSLRPSDIASVTVERGRDSSSNPRQKGGQGGKASEERPSRPVGNRGTSDQLRTVFLCLSTKKKVPPLPRKKDSSPLP